ncbi:MAG: UbiA family prenyltransferase [Candidatus Thermoplasmatota archaeon]|nr:UbiA family prenyltransferase [Candidatus Thermoplasmatota archaeon]
MKKIVDIITLGRPMPFPPHVIAGLCGVVMAYSTFLPEIANKNEFLFNAIFGSVIMAFANAASNIFNQITDIEIDRINKPDRPLPSGRVSVSEAAFLSTLIYISVIAFASFINQNFLAAISMFIIVTVLYSVPPFLFKKRFWLSNASIAVARGVLLPLAGWCIVPGTSLFDPQIIAVSAFLFFFLLGASGTKDFSDIEGDRQHGMRTLPVEYGIEKAASIISYFFIVPFVLVPLFVAGGWLPVGTLIVLVLMFWGAHVAYKLHSLSMNPETGFENTGVWVHMYFLLVAAQVFMAAGFLFGSFP